MRFGVPGLTTRKEVFAGAVLLWTGLLLAGWGWLPPDIARADGGVSVANARVRIPADGVPVHAGYFDIRNSGSGRVLLTHATADVYGKVELHRSMIVNGVASMEPIDHVAIEPGAVVKFEPGGLHLMLMKPKEKLSSGKGLELRLHFVDGSSVTADAVVEVLATGPGAQHGQHGHHKH